MRRVGGLRRLLGLGEVRALFGSFCQLQFAFDWSPGFSVWDRFQGAGLQYLCGVFRHRSSGVERYKCGN